VARLLVSVRSAAEAKLAVDAGAAIIDVKEPDQGSLGRAPSASWREIRATCPACVPLSVALGELIEWLAEDREKLSSSVWEGISFRKLGMAGSGSRWKTLWAEVRAYPDLIPGPPWIAVAYADWKQARAPGPDEILAAASDDPSIEGILIDTWDKTRPFCPDVDWIRWAKRVRSSGRILAIAGGLNLASIRTLDPMAPDIVAVRGAACVGGRRTGTVDPARVAELARRVSELPSPRLA